MSRSDRLGRYAQVGSDVSRANVFRQSPADGVLHLRVRDVEVHLTASIRSMGSAARRITSSESSMRGSSRSSESRSFSSVLRFMYGHSLQLQFSFGTK